MVISDIHVHPTLMAFGSGPNGPKQDIFLYSRLNRPVTSGTLRFLQRFCPKMVKPLSETYAGSQSDFSKMAEGGVRFAVVVCGSIESGFARPQLSAIPKFGSIADFFVGVHGEDRLVESITGVHETKVGFIARQLHNAVDNPSYFDLFMQEMQYITDHDSETFDLPDGRKFKINIPKSDENLQAALKLSPNAARLVVLLAIEGMQSMGIGLRQDQLEPDFHERIVAAKNHFGIILYAGLNHHFHNYLGGHAKTMTGLLANILPQGVQPSQGLTDRGKLVIRSLLDTSETGKRILVDVKHMNLATRQDYYAMLALEYAGENIPIICSHTGMTNQSWATEMRNPGAHDTDERNKTTYFHEWSVNLYQEDVLAIVASGGLIGIQLDEKRMGGGRPREVLMAGKTGEQARIIMADLFLANILSVIQTCAAEAERLGTDVSLAIENAWRCLVIGSDFDGIINPVDNVLTAADLQSYPLLLAGRIDSPDLQYTLNDHTWELPNERIQFLLQGKTGTQRIAQVFSTNFTDFLRGHFVG